MNDIVCKSVDLDIKSIENNVFEGYASVFGNIDSHNDIIIKGAFSKTINNSIALLWQHDTNHPIGKIQEIYEDDIGLFIKASIIKELQMGQEAYIMIKKSYYQWIIDWISSNQKHL